MPVARRVWNKRLDHIVLLTPEEGAQWNQIYKVPSELHIWWFSLRSYNIDEKPERLVHRGRSDDSTGKPPQCLWDESDIPPGCEAWTYSSGMTFGPLAGGGSTDLWLWDGQEPRRIRELSCWMS
jgi:hypothetical protein